MCELDHDGEASTVYRESWHRARKPFKCASCSTMKEPGVKYLRHFQVFDGEVYYSKVCTPCGNAHKAFVKEHHGGMYPPDDVRESLSECIENGDAISRKRWQPVLSALRRRIAAAHASHDAEALSRNKGTPHASRS